MLRQMSPTKLAVTSPTVRQWSPPNRQVPQGKGANGEEAPRVRKEKVMGVRKHAGARELGDGPGLSASAEVLMLIQATDFDKANPRPAKVALVVWRFCLRLVSRATVRNPSRKTNLRMKRLSDETLIHRFLKTVLQWEHFAGKMLRWIDPPMIDYTKTEIFNISESPCGYWEEKPSRERITVAEATAAMIHASAHGGILLSASMPAYVDRYMASWPKRYPMRFYSAEEKLNMLATRRRLQTQYNNHMGFSRRFNVETKILSSELYKRRVEFGKFENFANSVALQDAGFQQHMLISQMTAEAAISAQRVYTFRMLARLYESIQEVVREIEADMPPAKREAVEARRLQGATWPSRSQPRELSPPLGFEETPPPLLEGEEEEEEEPPRDTPAGGGAGRLEESPPPLPAASGAASPEPQEPADMPPTPAALPSPKRRKPRVPPPAAAQPPAAGEPAKQSGGLVLLTPRQRWEQLRISAPSSTVAQAPVTRKASERGDKRLSSKEDTGDGDEFGITASLERGKERARTDGQGRLDFADEEAHQQRLEELTIRRDHLRLVAVQAGNQDRYEALLKLMDTGHEKIMKTAVAVRQQEEMCQGIREDIEENLAAHAKSSVDDSVKAGNPPREMMMLVEHLNARKVGVGGLQALQRRKEQLQKDLEDARTETEEEKQLKAQLDDVFTQGRHRGAVVESLLPPGLVLAGGGPPRSPSKSPKGDLAFGSATPSAGTTSTKRDRRRSAGVTIPARLGLLADNALGASAAANEQWLRGASKDGDQMLDCFEDYNSAADAFKITLEALTGPDDLEAVSDAATRLARRGSDLLHEVKAFLDAMEYDGLPVAIVELSMLDPDLDKLRPWEVMEQQKVKAPRGDKSKSKKLETSRKKTLQLVQQQELKTRMLRVQVQELQKLVAEAEAEANAAAQLYADECAKAAQMNRRSSKTIEGEEATEVKEPAAVEPAPPPSREMTKAESQVAVKELYKDLAAMEERKAELEAILEKLQSAFEDPSKLEQVLRDVQQVSERRELRKQKTNVQAKEPGSPRGQEPSRPKLQRQGSGPFQGPGKDGQAAAAAKSPAPPGGEEALSVTVTVPVGALPGNMLEVAGPGGQAIQVQVPEGAKPGMVLQVQAQRGPPTPLASVRAVGSRSQPTVAAPPSPQGQTFSVTVPMGAKVGDTFQVTVPGGFAIQVKVPRGAPPGAQIHVQLPAVPQAAHDSSGNFLSITLPEGAKPGSFVQVAKPDGTFMQVQVPMNAAPGQVLTVPAGRPASAGQARGHRVLEITVPADAKPGSMVQVMTPSGAVQVQVPADYVPGSPLHVQVPDSPQAGGAQDALASPMSKRQSLRAYSGPPVVVVVPEGVKPGDTMKVQIPPGGDPLSVRVPEGAVAGSKIRFDPSTRRRSSLASMRLRRSTTVGSVLSLVSGEELLSDADADDLGSEDDDDFQATPSEMQRDPWRDAFPNDEEEMAKRKYMFCASNHVAHHKLSRTNDLRRLRMRLRKEVKVRKRELKLKMRQMAFFVTGDQKQTAMDSMLAPSGEWTSSGKQAMIFKVELGRLNERSVMLDRLLEFWQKRVNGFDEEMVAKKEAFRAQVARVLMQTLGLAKALGAHKPSKEDEINARTDSHFHHRREVPEGAFDPDDVELNEPLEEIKEEDDRGSEVGDDMVPQTSGRRLSPKPRKRRLSLRALLTGEDPATTAFLKGLLANLTQAQASSSVGLKFQEPALSDALLVRGKALFKTYLVQVLQLPEAIRSPVIEHLQGAERTRLLQLVRRSTQVPARLAIQACQKSLAALERDPDTVLKELTLEMNADGDNTAAEEGQSSSSSSSDSDSSEESYIDVRLQTSYRRPSAAKAPVAAQTRRPSAMREYLFADMATEEAVVPKKSALRAARRAELEKVPSDGNWEEKGWKQVSVGRRVSATAPNRSSLRRGSARKMDADAHFLGQDFAIVGSRRVGRRQATVVGFESDGGESSGSSRSGGEARGKRSSRPWATAGAENDDRSLSLNGLLVVAQFQGKLRRAVAKQSRGKRRSVRRPGIVRPAATIHEIAFEESSFENGSTKFDHFAKTPKRKARFSGELQRRGSGELPTIGRRKSNNLGYEKVFAQRAGVKDRVHLRDAMIEGKRTFERRPTALPDWDQAEWTALQKSMKLSKDAVPPSQTRPEVAGDEVPDSLSNQVALADTIRVDPWRSKTGDVTTAEEVRKKIVRAMREEIQRRSRGDILREVQDAQHIAFLERSRKRGRPSRKLEGLVDKWPNQEPAGDRQQAGEESPRFRRAPSDWLPVQDGRDAAQVHEPESPRRQVSVPDGPRRQEQALDKPKENAAEKDIPKTDVHKVPRDEGQVLLSLPRVPQVAPTVLAVPGTAPSAVAAEASIDQYKYMVKGEKVTLIAEERRAGRRRAPSKQSQRARQLNAITPRRRGKASGFREGIPRWERWVNNFSRLSGVRPTPKITTVDISIGLPSGSFYGRRGSSGGSPPRASDGSPIKTNAGRLARRTLTFWNGVVTHIGKKARKGIPAGWSRPVEAVTSDDGAAADCEDADGSEDGSSFSGGSSICSTDLHRDHEDVFTVVKRGRRGGQAMVTEYAHDIVQIGEELRPSLVDNGKELELRMGMPLLVIMQTALNEDRDCREVMLTLSRTPFMNAIKGMLLALEDYYVRGEGAREYEANQKGRRPKSDGQVHRTRTRPLRTLTAGGAGDDLVSPRSTNGKDEEEEAPNDDKEAQSIGAMPEPRRLVQHPLVASKGHHSSSAPELRSLAASNSEATLSILSHESQVSRIAGVLGSVHLRHRRGSRRPHPRQPKARRRSSEESREKLEVFRTQLHRDIEKAFRRHLYYWQGWLHFRHVPERSGLVTGDEASAKGACRLRVNGEAMHIEGHEHREPGSFGSGRPALSDTGSETATPAPPRSPLALWTPSSAASAASLKSEGPSPSSATHHWETLPPLGGQKSAPAAAAPQGPEGDAPGPAPKVRASSKRLEPPSRMPSKGATGESLAAAGMVGLLPDWAAAMAGVSPGPGRGSSLSLYSPPTSRPASALSAAVDVASPGSTSARKGHLPALHHPVQHKVIFPPPEALKVGAEELPPSSASTPQMTPVHSLRRVSMAVSPLRKPPSFQPLGAAAGDLPDLGLTVVAVAPERPATQPPSDQGGASSPETRKNMRILKAHQREEPVPPLTGEAGAKKPAELEKAASVTPVKAKDVEDQYLETFRVGDLETFLEKLSSEVYSRPGTGGMPSSPQARDGAASRRPLWIGGAPPQSARVEGRYGGGGSQGLGSKAHGPAAATPRLLPSLRLRTPPSTVPAAGGNGAGSTADSWRKALLGGSAAGTPAGASGRFPPRLQPLDAPGDWQGPPAGLPNAAPRELPPDVASAHRLALLADQVLENLGRQDKWVCCTERQHVPTKRRLLRAL